MDILFKTTKLRKACNSKDSRAKCFGVLRAKHIGRRLDDMHAADCLADLAKLPQTRCHELKGNRNGQLSVDLDHPYRLIFEITDEPLPLKSDGGLDWNKVKKVRIIGIEDTHGK